MAMTVIPYIEHSTGYAEQVTEFLKSLGLIDVEAGYTSSNLGIVCRFKFPDGTPVNDAVIFDNDYRYFIMHDFEAHILIIIRNNEVDRRPYPDKAVAYAFAMCVLPTTSGDTIELRRLVPDDNTKLNDVFNTMAWPNYANTINPDSCTLLPAYVGVPRGLFEIPNCYVTLNATNTPGTKFVDETGAKWIALGGSLLYKVPTIE